MLGKNTRIKAAMQQIAVQTAFSFQADICVICLSDASGAAEKFVFGHDRFLAWSRRDDLCQFFRSLTSSRKTLIVNSLPDDTSVPADVAFFLQAQGIQAFVSIPMLAGNAQYGTLFLFFTVQRHLTAADLQHLTAVANTAAMTLQTNGEEVLPQTHYDNIFENIVSRSPAMHEVFDIMQRAARTDANVLIHGESGVGKELIARGIHHLSRRKNRAFIPVDCVALPSTLLESELFGHEKGAFTGADARKNGLLEFANTGTFFLDEIAELDFSLQAKLLRVLQERKFRRIGSQELISVDIKVISATNREPEAAVREKALREDLYYRLNVIPIHVPALRERKADISLLATHFMNKFIKANDLSPKGFAAETLSRLEDYAWPGNVRELQNVIERTASLSRGELIQPADLPGYIKQSQAPTVSSSTLPPDASQPWHDYYEELKLNYFKALIEKMHGNLEEVAREAQVSLRTVYRVANDFNLGHNGLHLSKSMMPLSSKALF